jgi:hypothetical protein
MARTTRALVLAGAAITLALPAAASAHVATGEVTCTDATFNATGWTPGTERTWSLEVDGVQTATGVHRFTASGHAFAFPLTLAPGAHDVTFRVGTFTATGSVSCPAPPAPPAPPVPPAPPAPVAPVAAASTTPAPAVVARPRPTCGHLRAVGAGRRWLVTFGCPTRARITCADVPNSAGRAWFDGSRLAFRCPLPQRLRAKLVVIPPVLG